ncbi:MAG: hypothetical protein H7Z37_12480 [Pyrinomonadaceae bacterium]|nr:hypothetical protein [Pyrinomonadaceae bacterium]
MLDYWVRLYRKYNLPVIQILVMLRETKTDIPTNFGFVRRDIVTKS